MSKVEEYKRYMKKCEMLGTKMFEFEVIADEICITGYIENEESERLVKIPDFVDFVDVYAFKGVRQDLKIISDSIATIRFNGYLGDRLELNGLNTSEVGSMYYMFNECSYIKNLDTSHMDTRKVRNMEKMFSYCEKLKKLDLRGFNTSNVITMSDMFSGCTDLMGVDLSSFNTNKVQDMSGMFDECMALRELDLSSFDTSNVNNVYGMFYNCANLKILNISNFDLSRVELPNARNMFRACRLDTIITNIKMRDWLKDNRQIIGLDRRCSIMTA